MTTFTNVALSNTFNEFRQAHNNIANTLTDITTEGEYSSESLYVNVVTANTLVGANATVSNLANLANVNVSTLTSGRVVLAGTSGRLQDDSGLTFNTTTNTLSPDNLTVSGNSTFTGTSTFNGSGVFNSDVNIGNNNIRFHAANGSATFANTTYAEEVHGRRAHMISESLVITETASWISSRNETEDQHLVLAIGDTNGPHDVAVTNKSTGANAYAEFIAYSTTGNSEAGWLSMGINSPNYTESAFSLTGPDEAYILYEAEANTSGSGNFIIGTGANGSENKIILAAGGFNDPANNQQMVITPGQNIHIEIDTQSSNTTTGALTVNGGIGLVGNLNIGGNVAITGTITLGGGGNTVSTSSLQVDNPIIFVGSNNAADTFDLGINGEYTATGTKYTGLVRDASDNGKWKLYSGISNKPANTVNFTGASYDTLYLGGIQAVGGTSSTSNTTGTIIVTGGIGLSGNLFSGGTVNDSLGNVREVPQNATTGTYTLVAADSGKHVTATGNVTVPASVFTVGQTVTIYNNSGSSISILQGSSATLRQAGTSNTGTRTLAQRGVCTILCVATNDFVINGGGLT